MKSKEVQKFEAIGKIVAKQARRENRIYAKYLLPFAKKIKLHEGSKTFEEAAKKAILWQKELEKHNIFVHTYHFS